MLQYDVVLCYGQYCSIGPISSVVASSEIYNVHGQMKYVSVTVTVYAVAVNREFRDFRVSVTFGSSINPYYIRYVVLLRFHDSSSTSYFLAKGLLFPWGTTLAERLLFKGNPSENSPVLSTTSFRPTPTRRTVHRLKINKRAEH